ncbi:NAD-dependent succinate-semialdehyde dehydrogenase [Sphingomonas sp. AOB5]|uniref:NAD-dependent succinate-semialdehyde dehydrogenase n=1 Tax=Sphingomonas sp. AOB5 TaxID=3034017 RepID=UPI0023F956F4|nr:NAD-dependent succinate-semialdehyde dehydrogenase [Sphingomonas sp. AOB5]MDF7774776.1 NAD-dependent succinate-semialdehyde dehydrogenase [Sphingomonas sp. AOB5]
MGYPELKFLIGGEWRSAAPGEQVINPSDGSVIAELPHAGRAELDAAIAAAERGLEVWRKVPPNEREAILLRAADLLGERKEEIALAIALDQGKTLPEARSEVDTARARIVWDAAEGRRLYGRIIPSAPGFRKLSLRLPLGVVAAFTPWNYPLASPTRKVAGALAAGCSIILKGAEETPSGPMALIRAFHDAGVPPGVINLVYGKPAEISEYLIPHPAVKLVTFTGSVPVGKHLAALCGKHMKPAIMELGGNSPVILWEDADPDALGPLSVVGKSRNAGQVCVSPTRFFVHERIYDRFVESFSAAAQAWRTGPALDAASQMGPLINQRRLDAIEGYVADAAARGARVASGGQRIGNEGYLYPLTVLADMPADARAMIEEPFGPLALIHKVSTLDETIAKANSVPFGLAAYAFTDSARVSDRLIEEVECGSLSIGHYTSSYPEVPFGGIKDSGYGREGGAEGLDGYTYVKGVTQLMG